MCDFLAVNRHRTLYHIFEKFTNYMKFSDKIFKNKQPSYLEELNPQGI
jgi:hypothetical protein